MPPFRETGALSGGNIYFLKAFRVKKKTASFKTEQSYGKQFQRILKTESFSHDNCYRIAGFNMSKYYEMKSFWIKSKQKSQEIVILLIN